MRATRKQGWLVRLASTGVTQERTFADPAIRVVLPSVMQGHWKASPKANPDVAPNKNPAENGRVDSFNWQFRLLNDFNQLPLALAALTVVSFKFYRPVDGRCVPE